MKKFTRISTLVFLLIFAACSREFPKSTQAVLPPNSPSHPGQSNPNEKFGLPESTRREIYEGLKDVERNAEITAKKRFPGRGSFVLVPESPLVKKREGVVQELLGKAKNAMAAMYNLTVEQVEEIGREGKEKLWMPTLPSPQIGPDGWGYDSGWRLPPAGPI